MQDLLTPTGWAELSGLTLLVGAIWKIIHPLSKGIWELVKTWRQIAEGFPRLTKEVTDIKELLQQDAAWRKRQEKDTRETKERVDAMETSIGKLTERTARLEGITDNAS